MQCQSVQYIISGGVVFPISFILVALDFDKNHRTVRQCDTNLKDITKMIDFLCRVGKQIGHNILDWSIFNLLAVH